jgi:hypothetical protein
VEQELSAGQGEWEIAELVVQAELTMAAPPVDPLRRARPRDSHLRGDMTDRALLTTLHQTQSAFERQRGITVGHEGQVRSLARSAPATAHFPPCATPATRAVPLLFIQADIGAVVRGVKAGEFDYPT